MNYLLEFEESERLRFRRLLPSDWDIWLNFFADSGLAMHWKSSTTDPVVLCNRWFEKNFSRYNNSMGGMNVLIEKHSGAFIGQCGLLIQRVDGQEELEVGYSILPDHRRKGYATEAARKCIHYAFKNGWTKSIISIIHELNTESQKVALNNGMTFSHRTFYDGNPVNIYRIYPD